MSELGARHYPYQQVAAKIISKIRAGELAPEDKLPSIREIAADYGITTATAQRVLRELGDSGFADTVPGVGSFVSRVIPDHDPVEPVADVVAQLAAELSALNRTVAALAERVDAIEGKGSAL
jgi:DNA-binding transcriptional regulator YhcF (GntR family)